jgi:hypothetical protein
MKKKTLMNGVKMKNVMLQTNQNNTKNTNNENQTNPNQRIKNFILIFLMVISKLR